MKTFENNIATTKQTAKNERGFTLIELLVACGIIAILIGLLLPAIQKKREEYAADRASANLNALLVASNEYFAQTGSYPHKIADLAEFCKANPALCSLDPQLATGRKDGYRFGLSGDFDGDGDVDGADFLAVAEPEHPGITGSVTLTINQTGLVTSNPTPGADEAREQMFNRIRAKAAETIVKLLGLDPAASSEVREYTEMQGGTGIDYFDFNNDGDVSISEIRNYDDPNMDSALSNPIKEFIAFVASEMKWDALTDGTSNTILVGESEIEAARGEEPPLFSFDGLSILTITVFGQAGNDTLALVEKLEAAEAAEAMGDLRGRDKAVKSYQKAVKAQINKTITRSNAKTLVTMADVLISQ